MKRKYKIIAITLALALICATASISTTRKNVADILPGPWIISAQG